MSEAKDQGKDKGKKEASGVNFTELAAKCRKAKDEDLNDLLKQNVGVIKRAVLRERKINRVGMPLAHKIDDRAEEIPIVCGIKKGIQYIGGIGGCVYLGIKAKQLLF